MSCSFVEKEVVMNIVVFDLETQNLL